MFLFVVVYDGYLYIFGGYNGLHDIHFRDVFRFDPGNFLYHIIICIKILVHNIHKFNIEINCKLISQPHYHASFITSFSKPHIQFLLKILVLYKIRASRKYNSLARVFKCTNSNVWQKEQSMLKSIIHAILALNQYQVYSQNPVLFSDVFIAT